MTASRLTVPWLLCVALLHGGPALGQSEQQGQGPPQEAMRAQLKSFLSKALPAREEKKAAAVLAKIITDAAHPTGADSDLLSYTIDNQNPKFVNVHLRVEYFGGLTNRKYTATIYLAVDRSDNSAWEVQRLSFSDSTNRIRPNEHNLSAVRRKLNGLLEE